MSVASLSDALRSEQLPGPAQRAELLATARQVKDASAEEVEDLLQALRQFAARHASGTVPIDRDALLARLLEGIAERFQRPDGDGKFVISSSAIEELSQLYRGLGPRGENRFHLLRALAATGSPPALAAFAELVVADPPVEQRQCDLAFVPLFQQPALDVSPLFPELLSALSNPKLAVLVLDLANYVTRNGLARAHPACERLPQLLDLCGGVVKRLQELERSPEDFAASPRELGQLVGDGAALLIALCDALGLIGDARAAGRLRDVLELSHRRLRAEAATALARLGDKQGIEELVALTREPSLRRRAVAYLRELQLADKVPPEADTPLAAAEGDLAAWLADPLRFGIAPHRLELFDHATQRWPDSAAPVDCFLFRCEYDFPAGRWCGIGIAGPLVQCLNVDLADLPPTDIYALYAGRQAARAAQGESDVQSFSETQQEQAVRAEHELTERGYEDVRVVKLAEIGGELAAIAAAHSTGGSGVVALHEGKAAWFPRRNSTRPLGTDEVYWITLGRHLRAS